jgi:hypothetical protein
MLSVNTMPPAHWPASVVFSSTYVFHSSVPPDHKSFILGKFTQSDRGPFNRSPVVIKPVKAKDHPAFGQHGLFASKKIPPKTLILYYTGEVGESLHLILTRVSQGSNGPFVSLILSRSTRMTGLNPTTIFHYTVLPMEASILALTLLELEMRHDLLTTTEE